MTMRFKPHDLFFWALCSGLVLVSVFVLFIALACASPPAYAQDRCAGIGVISSAVRVQGFAVAVETDPALVQQVLDLLKANGFPKDVQADGLFFVKMPSGIRVSFITAGCLSGMVSVDPTISEAIRKIVKFEAAGRDA